MSNVVTLNLAKRPLIPGLLGGGVVLLAILSVLWFGFTRSVGPDKVGIRQVYFGPGAGVQETVVGPGLALVIPGYETLHTFPRDLQVLEGPEERDGTVWMRWRVSYSSPGAPPLVMEGEETATFEGDRIKRLEDRFPPDAGKNAVAWMTEHGAALKPA